MSKLQCVFDNVIKKAGLQKAFDDNLYFSHFECGPYSIDQLQPFCLSENELHYFKNEVIAWQREFDQATQSVYYLDHRRHGQFQANFVNQKIGYPKFLRSDSNANRSKSQQLNNDGVCSLGSLISQRDIDKVLEITDTLKMVNIYNNEELQFDKDQIPRNCNFGHFMHSDIVKIPEILKLMNSPEVIGPVTCYLGCLPTIVNIVLQWSFADRHLDDSESQNFHLDPGIGKVVKLFTYLTDVGETTGPTTFVSGSEKLNQKLLLIEDHVKHYYGDEYDCIKDLIHWGGRKSDNEICEAYGVRTIQPITGESGHSFLGNTRCYHKGMIPKNKPRLALIVEYGALPIGYDPEKNGGGEHEADEAWQKLIEEYSDVYPEFVLNYVNRLIVNSRSMRTAVLKR